MHSLTNLVQHLKVLDPILLDPELVQNLDNGLYKIETNYQNGVDEEIVIYKSGN